MEHLPLVWLARPSHVTGRSRDMPTPRSWHNQNLVTTAVWVFARNPRLLMFVTIYYLHDAIFVVRKRMTQRFSRSSEKPWLHSFEQERVLSEFMSGKDVFVALPNGFASLHYIHVPPPAFDVQKFGPQAHSTLLPSFFSRSKSFHADVTLLLERPVKRRLPMEPEGTGVPHPRQRGPR